MNIMFRCSSKVSIFVDINNFQNPKMKKVIILIGLISLIFSCKKENVGIKKVIGNEKFASFGDSISSENVLSKDEMFNKYEALKEGDTINVKFRSNIKSVCQKKGCWMNMDLNDKNEAFVKFKDYGFFMPKNASGSEAIVNGKAFISVETVAELKHYAKDAGKSQAAIDSILAPKTNYSFMANGVLIKQ